MQQKPDKMEKHRMINATHTAKQWVDRAIERAYALEYDTDKENRIEKQLCKSCYYLSSGLGGHAFTNKPCMSCGEVQVYGSTYTDALCLICAQKHSICKHCSGDLEMRTKRRKWPESLTNIK